MKEDLIRSTFSSSYSTLKNLKGECQELLEYFNISKNASNGFTTIFSTQIHNKRYKKTTCLKFLFFLCYLKNIKHSKK